MDYAINDKSITMPNTKARKKDVAKRIREKLEEAKLNLIYTELEEAGIGFVRGYESVDRLLSDIKKNNELDYNRAKSIADSVSGQLEGMVNELENGSTNAFTKIMTSPISKSIAKTLGISLAGRTALLLAPTVASKAVIGAALAGYGLYRVIKSRKEIIRILKVIGIIIAIIAVFMVIYVPIDYHRINKQSGKRFWVLCWIRIFQFS